MAKWVGSVSVSGSDSDSDAVADADSGLQTLYAHNVLLMAYQVARCTLQVSTCTKWQVAVLLLFNFTTITPEIAQVIQICVQKVAMKMARNNANFPGEN